MQLENAPAASAAGAGLAGTVRLIAILLIGLLATLGVLMVFDLLPRGLFEEYAAKIGWATGIVVVACAAVALVVKAGRSR
jgi:hypothetical protein